MTGAGGKVPTIAWDDLVTGQADDFDDALVEIAGWIAPLEAADRHDYFLFAPDFSCCLGCLPRNPLAAVEVFAETAIPAQIQAVRLIGRWRRLIDDPAGWRYQLRDARLIGVELVAPQAPAPTRRGLLAAGALIGLAACGAPPATRVDPGAGRRLVDAGVTIDLHSHAGLVRLSRRGNTDERFQPLAEPMRDGGLAAVCLAVIADGPVTRTTADDRIEAYRSPAPGELSTWGRYAFARLARLVEEQKLAVVTDAASLRDARRRGPSVVVASEGADFLEGSLERLSETHTSDRLRHLQLTHYRVNELGDIQTEPPVHGGLTDFGAEVVRACNRLGIVVDVAHGTYDLVKRAAAVTSKPLVLSHSSLTLRPSPRGRTISRDHALAVAGTGGVIGIWPLITIFRDHAEFAAGIARMADAVGVDHVGIGSDMLGLPAGSAFSDYRQLPNVAETLLATGFNPDEISKILGGNYLRVFAASVG